MRHVRLAVIVLAIFICLPQLAVSQPRGVLIVVPERVDIDLFYGGADIEVAAEVPAGYEVAVRLMTRPERLELKKLGKKAGLLWMGAGDAIFENIPVVYQVLSSAPLENLAPLPLRAQWKLGYRSLISDKDPGADMRGELVGLKEHQGLFVIRQGALVRNSQSTPASSQVTDVANTGEPPSAAPTVQPPEIWRGTFRLPALAPAGDYSVELIGFKDGRAFHLANSTLHLKNAGAVRLVRYLAIDHGLIYGCAASLIAILVGLLTGVLFRSRSNEGH